MIEQVQKPRWIMSVNELPKARGKTSLVIVGTTEITVQKRWLQMVEAIQIGPVFCASPVRLSDAVCVLRCDYNVAIETNTTPEGRKFYQLACEVREVAA